jgi:hypothetical protein
MEEKLAPETTREQRAAIVERVNASFAVDDLIPNHETRLLQEEYISGRYSIAEIIEQAKQNLQKKVAARQGVAPVSAESLKPSDKGDRVVTR